MQAGLITGKGRFELVEVPEPEPGAGQALVQIDRCGVCGSDVAAYRTGDPYTPFMHGHEWTGTVLGGRGISLSEGERVVLGTAPPCGSCPSCRAGRTEFCDGVLAIAPPVPPHGGYAPRINVDASRLHRVPDNVPLDVAAQIEPATVALHGVRRTEIHQGDVVVVTGAGEIGLIAMQLATIAGAETIVIEPNDQRRTFATAALGARVVASADEVTERADVVLECAGAAAAIGAGLRLLRTGGQMTLIGVPHGHVSIDPNLWLIRQATIRTSLAHNAWDFDASIRLIADGRLTLAPLADRTITLAELPDAFASLAGGTSGAVKVLVDPHL